MSREKVYQELERGLEDLEKNIDKYTSESCERLTLEVLKEGEVSKAFVNLILQGYDFEQTSCKGEIDQVKVTFMFRCRPPRICFLHPYFVITYDISLHKVVGDIVFFP